MSAVTPYLSRQADLQIFPLYNVLQLTPDLPSFLPGTPVTQGIAGVQKAAQWVALQLLTRRDNSSYFQDGTYLLSDLFKSAASNIVATQAFYRAAQIVLDLAAVRFSTYPDDERVVAIELLSLNFDTPDSLSLTMRIITAAGTDVDLQLPLQYNIQDQLT